MKDIEKKAMVVTFSALCLFLFFVVAGAVWFTNTYQIPTDRATAPLLSSLEL